jgi:DNA primase
MILEQGMNVKVVLFPEGEDPDSFARKNRSSDVEAFVNTQASDFIAFKTRLLIGETNNDPIKKAALIHEIIQSISLIPDGIIRPLYVRECAEIMGLAEQTLMNELNKALRKKRSKGDAAGMVDEVVPDEQIQAPPQELLIDITDASAQELDLIRVLLYFGNKRLKFIQPTEDPGKTTEFEVGVAEYVCNDMRANQIIFDSPVYQKIFDIYAAGVDIGEVPDEQLFLHNVDQEIANISINIISQHYELSPGWEEIKIYVKLEEDKLEDVVSQSMLALMHRKLSAMIFLNQKEMRELPPTSENWADHLSRDIHLKQARNEISRRLGRTLNG